MGKDHSEDNAVLHPLDVSFRLKKDVCTCFCASVDSYHALRRCQQWPWLRPGPEIQQTCFQECRPPGWRTFAVELMPSVYRCREIYFTDSHRRDAKAVSAVAPLRALTTLRANYVRLICRLNLASSLYSSDVVKWLRPFVLRHPLIPWYTWAFKNSVYSRMFIIIIKLNFV